MDEYHVVSLSGGKDSTAMLLRMLELGMHVDEIIFCDTGVEFPQMYEHLDRVEQYTGRKITRLHAEHDFEYHLLKYQNDGLKRRGRVGKSWPSAKIRWCTGVLKREVEKKYLSGRANVIRYIGIAADEPKRVKDKRYPLVEWGWTESDCLEYCYSKGFDWGGLYEIFPRVSCWCCPLQRIENLRTLRHHFPELWARLGEWDRQTWREFKGDYTIKALEKRFAAEDRMARDQINLFDELEATT